MKRHGAEGVFYWMSVAQEEVDFVVKPKQKVEQLVQVCYSLEIAETKKEINALLKGEQRAEMRQSSCHNRKQGRRREIWQKENKIYASLEMAS